MAERTDTNDRKRQAGEWLAAARKAAGLTQSELEFAARLGKNNLTNYERGVSWVPDDVAERIAHALGLGVIETRRGLGLWVPADAVDEPQEAIDLIALIRRDPHLVPEARKHFENQYKLLRRLSVPAPDAVTGEGGDLLELPHAARKRPPRKQPRS